MTQPPDHPGYGGDPPDPYEPRPYKPRHGHGGQRIPAQPRPETPHDATEQLPLIPADPQHRPSAPPPNPWSPGPSNPPRRPSPTPEPPRYPTAAPEPPRYPTTEPAPLRYLTPEPPPPRYLTPEPPRRRAADPGPPASWTADPHQTQPWHPGAAEPPHPPHPPHPAYEPHELHQTRPLRTERPDSRHRWETQPSLPPQQPARPPGPQSWPQADHTAEIHAIPAAERRPRSRPDNPLPPSAPDKPLRPSGPDKPRPFSAVLGVVAGVVAVALLGLAVVVLLRHGETGGTAAAGRTIDPVSSDPTLVVDRWLNAMFVRRDADEMIKYTCKREADPDDVAAVIKKAEQAEQDAKAAKLTMKVSWTKPREVSRDEETAKVTSTLSVAIGDNTKKTAAKFDLVFETGWKVCDAEMR